MTSSRSSFDGIRIPLRTLRRQPGYTSVVVLSLALAISINTTMYSVLDALVNPRIDMRDPSGVYTVRLYGDYKGHVSRAQRDSMLRSGLQNIEAVAWVNGVSGVRGNTIEAATAYTEGSINTVSAEYFDLIGPKLIAGRLFSPADHFITPRPIVLGEKTASVLFPDGANPIGQQVRIDDSSYSVIGVLSRYSDFPDRRSSAWKLGTPSEREIFVRVIRLRPGSSPEEADRDLQMVAGRIAIAAGEAKSAVSFLWRRPSEPQFHAGRFHIAIGLSVVAVLLVACANIANMQLARGITRRRELALRSALGASRGKIVSHLLTESVVLAVGGLMLGIVLTWWGAELLRAAIPPAVGEYIVEPQLSWRVFVFAIVATLGCIVLVGLAPAIRVSRVDPNEMLKSGAGTGATRHHRRQYGVLVAVEIALALGLLIAATLMVRSTLRTSLDSLPFDPTSLILGSFADGVRGKPGEKRPLSEVLQAASARASQTPGVTRASAYGYGGLTGTAITISDSARGVREVQQPGWGYTKVSPGHLRTLGIPVVRGRDFRDGERDEAAVIIDEYTASALWPGGNPIGALIKFGDSKSAAPYVRIVGVAGLETRRHGGSPSTSIMRLSTVYYLPGPRDSIIVRQSGVTMVPFYASAPGKVASAASALRRAGARNVTGAAESIRRERAGIVFISSMFSLFAALGLGLAAFGIYGVVAHSVAERRRELGVRIALGATPRDVLHAVLRETVVIGLIGVALGLLLMKYGAMLLGRFAGDDVFNAPVFAAAAAFLFAVAATSALIPALRATKVDPTESLRCE